MVAVAKLRPDFQERQFVKKKSSRSFFLIQGAMSSRKTARQFPVLSGLHRAVDGALVGVLMTVSVMSALSLHWQHLWTVGFARLETTRELTHRLTESTASLERHLLKHENLPELMVPTKVSNLMYLNRSNQSSRSDKKDFKIFNSIKDTTPQITIHGY